MKIINTIIKIIKKIITLIIVAALVYSVYYLASEYKRVNSVEYAAQTKQRHIAETYPDGGKTSVDEIIEKWKNTEEGRKMYDEWYFADYGPGYTTFDDLTGLELGGDYPLKENIELVKRFEDVLTNELGIADIYRDELYNNVDVYIKVSKLDIDPEDYAGSFYFNLIGYNGTYVFGIDDEEAKQKLIDSRQRCYDFSKEHNLWSDYHTAINHLNRYLTNRDPYGWDEDASPNFNTHLEYD